ncbi:MAG: hypothetical protein JWM85_2724 [Acidimicrobiaceae bacterium]|nr:hypothetical protein [Acidimicrobiaceae bacterium]
MTTYPGELSIADVMSLRREDRSSHTFLRIVSKGEARASLSYAEADVATLSVAHALLALGLSAGDRVMIATPNCLEQILAMFGTARTTLVNVPINAASAPAEISYLVGLTEPACVVVGPEQADAFDRAELPAGAVRVAVVLGPNTGAHRWAARSVSWEELIASGKPTALPPPAARDTFQLLPTSGTTSRPKAVIHSHTTRLRSAFRAVLHTRIRDDDVLLNTFPAFHINCLDSAILPALVTGATAVIFETFSASSFWRVVRAEQATVVSVIPTLIRAVAAQPVNPEERQHCVRLISGSLRPSAAELQAFLERFALSRYESG